MSMKANYKNPSPLQLSIPFTIRPNSFYGVHVKYWIFPWIILIAATIFCMVIFPDYRLYFIIPIIASVLFYIWIYRSHKLNALTISNQSLSLMKNGVVQEMTFDDLATVSWGLMYAGGRTYWVLAIENKTKDVKWQLSPLYFWNNRELRTVYTSMPKQFQGPEDLRLI